MSEIRTVAVCGAGGTMGAGIAIVAGAATIVNAMWGTK